MNVCTLCESSEFIFMDGLNYCKVCNTMSQSHGVEQEAEKENTISNFIHLSKTSVKLAKQKIKENIPKKSFGIPWKCSEGFQIIIKNQVEALIALGANPILKEIMFRLWSLYLRNIGKAFLKKKLIVPESLRLKRKASDRHRDRYPGTIKDPRIKKVKWYLSSKTNWALKQQKIKENIKKQKLECGDDYVESESSDDSNRENFNDEDEKDKLLKQLIKEEKIYDDVRKKNSGYEVNFTGNGKTIIKQRYSNRNRFIGKMTLLRTISILYIGLQICNPEIQIHDLIRWINQGRLPYNRCSSWPSEMKLSFSDYDTFFAQKIPKCEEVYKQAHRLTSFLKLANLPYSNIHKIICHFILELALPSELNWLSKELIDQFPPFISLNTLNLTLQPSILAMAYLIMILKMLFSLDDITEKKLSEYVDFLNEVFSFNKQLFNWRDWSLYMQKKSSEQKAFTLVQNMNSIERISDIEMVTNTVENKLGSVRRIGNFRTSKWCKSRVNSLKKIASVLESWNFEKNEIKSSADFNYDNEDDELNANIENCNIHENSMHEKMTKNFDDFIGNRNQEQMNNKDSFNLKCNDSLNKSLFFDYNDIDLLLTKEKAEVNKFFSCHYKRTKNDFLEDSLLYVLNPKLFMLYVEDAFSDNIKNVSENILETMKEDDLKIEIKHNENSNKSSCNNKLNFSEIYLQLKNIYNFETNHPSKFYHQDPLSLFCSKISSDLFQVGENLERNNENKLNQDLSQNNKYFENNENLVFFNNFKSYNWLLEICSDHIGVNLLNLKETVNKLESVCINNDYQSGKNYIRSRFISSVFNTKKTHSKKIKGKKNLHVSIDLTDDEFSKINVE